MSAPTVSAVRSGLLRPQEVTRASAAHWDLAFLGILAYVVIEYTRLGDMFPLIGQLAPGKIAVALAVLGYLLVPRVRTSTGSTVGGMDICLVLLLGATFISTCFATYQSLAWTEFFEFVRYVVISFLIGRTVNSSWRVRVFFLIFLLLNLKLALFVIRGYLWDVAHGFSQSAIAAFGVGAGSVGYFSNAADFGVAMCVVWPIAMFLAFAERKFYLRLFYGGAAVVFFVSLLVCGSRGAVVGACAIGLVALAKNAKHLMALVMAAVLLLGIMFLLPEGMRNKFKSAENPTQDETANNRLLLWRAGWRMFKDHLLIGVGPANFPSVRSESYATFDLPPSHTVPHSVYIEALSELGILGCLPLVGIWLLVFRTNQRTRKLLLAQSAAQRRSVNYSLSIGLDLALVGFLVSGAFVAVLIYPHIWLLAGLSVGLHTACSRGQLEVSTAGFAENKKERRLASANA